MLFLRHQALASVRVLRALNRLHLRFGWTLERLHEAEDTRLPSFDRSTQNTSLLSQIGGTLFGTSSRCVGLGCNKPPPPNGVLSLGVYADGYKREGGGM